MKKNDESSHKNAQQLLPFTAQPDFDPRSCVHSERSYVLGGRYPSHIVATESSTAGCEPEIDNLGSLVFPD